MFLVVLAAALLLVTTVLAVTNPQGASWSRLSNTTKGAASATQIATYGGNISGLNLATHTQTEKWAGYFGNVEGNLTLDDSDGDTMYQWALDSVSGEVLATSNGTTPTWSALVNQTDCTLLEATVTGTGEDKESATFATGTLSGTFIVAGRDLSKATSCGTQTYNVTETGAWDEVIVSDAAGSLNIFTTFIANNSAQNDGSNGGCFNGQTCDYQIILPENGSNTIPTNYFFYVEIGS